MPSERFWNLPAEKRERIRRAAVQEMERVPFEEVSINKIITAAKIPRGSFYQYFEGKHDLLDFITQDYSTGMIEKLDESLRESGGDAFYAVEKLFDFTIGFALRPEYIKMCRNIFQSRMMHMKTTQDMLEYARQQEIIPQYFKNVSLENFRYKDEADLQDLLELLVTLFRTSLESAVADNASLPRVRASFLNKLKIIRNGVMKEEEKTNV